MNPILKQRNLLLTKEFEITDRSLKVMISTPFNYTEDEFTFEQLTTNVKRKKSPYVAVLIITAILIVGLIITVTSHFTDKNGSSIGDMFFYLVPLLIMAPLSYFQRTDNTNLFLYDRRVIPFYTNSPSRSEVDAFLDLIKTEQKKYLLSRYAKDDPYLTTEQIANNLQWLWDRYIIDNTELDELRTSLLKNRPNDDPKIGFKINPGSN